MESLEKTKKTINIRHSPAVWILVLCLVISLTYLIMYISDLNYSDETLVIMLNVLKYSSFFVCILSFYRLVLNLYRVFRGPSFSVFIQIFLYVVLIAYGLSIFFIEAFISVVAGGNG